MTIAATSTNTLDVSGIILRAYQLAGLMAIEQGADGPNWNKKFAFGRDMLQQILDELGTEGVFARAVNLELITMVAGQNVYNMPATVYDVVEDGSYIDPDQDVDAASGETPVIQKDREWWVRLSAKDASSIPVMFWTDRSEDPVKVYVWPTPSESGGSIRFQCHRLLADVSPGTVTVDLARFWTSYLEFELAFYLATAQSQPEAKCGMLASVAAKKLAKCKAASNQSVASQIWLDHDSPWSN